MPPSSGLPILWEDADLLAVNKPPGLASLPDGYDANQPHLRSLLEPEYGRLWIVHRLDRLTSGLIVLARNAAAHRLLNAQFEAHSIQKIYHAIVTGHPAWHTRQVNLALSAPLGRRKRVQADPQGKAAHTSLRLLRRATDEAGQPLSLVEARPRTGRTHQIRAHLYAEGHPIWQDPLYGPGLQANAAMPRLALHALELSLQHPSSGQPLTIQAAYADDFATALSGLSLLDPLVEA